MLLSSPHEHTKLWQLETSLGNLRLMRATYVRQTFARHMHEDFPVGVIERGALEFYYRGESMVAPVGSVNLANLGEPHTGHAALDVGWTYRMFYFDPDLIQRVASDITGKPRDIPFFQSGVLHDSRLAQYIQQLHHALEQDELERIEVEARIVEMLTHLILRHADDHPSPMQVGQEHRAVIRAREYIDAHFPDNLSLEDLASVAYLSPFHLARVFHNEVGLPPHAYLTQLRINHAKVLLARGYPITEVAFDVGFVDQSHLHKRFKAIVGMTPGQYRKNVQDK